MLTTRYPEYMYHEDFYGKMLDIEDVKKLNKIIIPDVMGRLMLVPSFYSLVNTIYHILDKNDFTKYIVLKAKSAIPSSEILPYKDVNGKCLLMISQEDNNLPPTVITTTGKAFCDLVLKHKIEVREQNFCMQNEVPEYVKVLFEIFEGYVESVEPMFDREDDNYLHTVEDFNFLSEYLE